jgi:hypothetical protein
MGTVFTSSYDLIAFDIFSMIFISIVQDFEGFQGPWGLTCTGGAFCAQHLCFGDPQVI